MYCIFTISNYTWDAYTYVYSVLPANRMRLCVHTSMYTSGFLQVVPHTKCVWWASTSPSCDASKYSVRRTTSIDLRSHCVWRLGTGTVPLSPSHLVVYLAPTVLLKSVLLLPSLLLAQCTCSTLFISSYTSWCNVFFYITHRSHSVFFIVVTVQLALWRTNLSLAKCRVPRSHSGYCNPLQRVSAVLSIPTLQWYTYEHICILSASCEQDATLCPHEYVY